MGAAVCQFVVAVTKCAALLRRWTVAFVFFLFHFLVNFGHLGSTYVVFSDGVVRVCFLSTLQVLLWIRYILFPLSAPLKGYERRFHGSNKGTETQVLSVHVYMYVICFVHVRYPS